MHLWLLKLKSEDARSIGGFTGYRHNLRNEHTRLGIVTWFSIAGWTQGLIFWLNRILFIYSILSFFLSFLMFIFIYLKGEDIDTEIFHMLVLSPNKHNSQNQAKPKLRSQISTWVSHMGGMDSSTWPIICYFPGCILIGSWVGTQFETRPQAVL